MLLILMTLRVLGDREATVNVVVVSLLITEAIMGIDFLKDHRASIDLKNGCLHPVPLQEPPERSTSTTHKVCTVSKIEMPPSSKLDIMAKVDKSVGEGTWVMEESTKVRLPVAVP